MKEIYIDTMDYVPDKICPVFFCDNFNVELTFVFRHKTLYESPIGARANMADKKKEALQREKEICQEVFDYLLKILSHLNK